MHEEVDSAADSSVICRFAAKAVAVADGYVLARYNEITSVDGNDDDALREWFLIQHKQAAGPLDGATSGGFSVHSDPGYHARPAPPKEVSNIDIRASHWSQQLHRHQGQSAQPFLIHKRRF